MRGWGAGGLGCRQPLVLRRFRACAGITGTRLTSLATLPYASLQATAQNCWLVRVPICYEPAAGVPVRPWASTAVACAEQAEASCPAGRKSLCRFLPVRRTHLTASHSACSRRPL